MKSTRQPDINKSSVKKISNRELVGLHKRIHQHIRRSLPFVTKSQIEYCKDCCFYKKPKCDITGDFKNRKSSCGEFK